MKRTLIVFGLLVALVMIMAGWRQYITPLNKISEIRKEFAAIARGDSEAVVLAKMKAAAMTGSSLVAPFWNEQRLSDEEMQGIQRSIGQRIVIDLAL